MKLKSLTDSFLITNTPSINEAEILTDTFLITNNASTEETEEFDRHVLHHHKYTIHWRSWRVSQTRPWEQIIPPKLSEVIINMQRSINQIDAKEHANNLVNQWFIRRCDNK